jgi:prepilin-type N-terminal cleavage/methylation domain-containing protein/prepilin-type processing-associated H-X9-DG protein
MNTQRRCAFTLVELLVVTGIIALLIGILLPALGKARAASYRTACAAQLRDLGNVMQMYINDNKGHIPYDHPQASNNFNIDAAMKPYPLQIVQSTPNYTYPIVTLWDVFDKYTGDKGFDHTKPYDAGAGFHKIWRCPADKIQSGDVPLTLNGNPIGGDTYFDAYGTSYEYDFWMNENHGGDEWKKVLTDAANGGVDKNGNKRPGVSADKYRILNDLTTFHGKPGALGNMNFLFADWHVGDLGAAISAKNAHAGGK